MKLLDHNEQVLNILIRQIGNRHQCSEEQKSFIRENALEIFNRFRLLSSFQQTVAQKIEHALNDAKKDGKWTDIYKKADISSATAKPDSTANKKEAKEIAIKSLGGTIKDIEKKIMSGEITNKNDAFEKLKTPLNEAIQAANAKQEKTVFGKKISLTESNVAKSLNKALSEIDDILKREPRQSYQNKAHK